VIFCSLFRHLAHILSQVLGTSTVTISWKIEEGTPGSSASVVVNMFSLTVFSSAGKYRIRYFGDSKTPVTGSIKAFEGVSGVFSVA